MSNVILKDAKTLHYVPSIWVYSFQVGSCLVFLALWILFGVRLFEAREYFSLIPFVLAFLLAQCSADFFGGVLHWIFDTWGSNTTPFIGFAIRSFRLHHVDKYEITRHDLFRSSFGIACILMPFFLISFFAPIHSMLVYFLLLFLFFLMFLVFMTNMFHRWAHLDHPSAPIRFLQKTHLILQNGHHDRHHTEPFNTAYCITNGWMNPVLKKIRFFQTMEKIITKVTGRIPRVDDIGLEAAKVIKADE